MTLKLTWDDLLIQNISAKDAESWLAEWPALVSGKFHPTFMSKFGNWFLRRPDGTTDLLDVLEGKLSTIAQTPAEFETAVNNIEWQETHLLSLLVYELHEKGKIPGEGQCYGFAPHPSLSGKNPSISGQIDTRFIMVLDISVWQTICSQTLFPRPE